MIIAWTVLLLQVWLLLYINYYKYAVALATDVNNTQHANLYIDVIGNHHSLLNGCIMKLGLK